MGICTSLCCSTDLSNNANSSCSIEHVCLLEENHLIIFDSPSYRNSLLKSFESECIVCFHELKNGQSISNNCSVNGCRLNGHQYCIYNWYLRHKKCPICNEQWVEPPRYNQLYRLSRSISEPGKPPDLNMIYEMKESMQKYSRNN